MERQSSDTKNIYKVRSMKTDLESGEKGAPPANIPIDLEKEKNAGLGIKPIKNISQENKKDSFVPPPPVLPKIENHENSNLTPKSAYSFQPKAPIFPPPKINPPSSPQISLPPIPSQLPQKKEGLIVPKLNLKTPVHSNLNDLEKPSQNFVAEQTKKLPRTGSPKKLPPRRIIALGALSFIILLFIIGEIWWFFIRPNPEPVLAPESFFPNPEEILPPVEEPEVIVSPEISAALLNYNKTEEINLSELSSEEISTKVSQFLSQPANENLLIRIVFIFESEKGQEVLDLKTFLSLSKIDIPESIANELGERYDLFFFTENSFDRTTCSKAGFTNNDCAGPRLGMAISIKETKDIRPLVETWEKTMVNNLQFILAPQSKASSNNFKSAIYAEVAIRYQNFPIDTKTIDYAISDNVFLMSASKTSMHAAIDALR